MNVVHVIGGLRGGGAERMIFALCEKSLKDPDLEMEVLLLTRRTDLLPKFNNAGITVHVPERMHRESEILFALSALIKLSALDCDVIHSHMFHGCIAASIIKFLRPHKLHVFSLHNSIQPGLFRQVMLFLTRFLRDKDIVFPGNKLRWYQKKKPVVIPNGVTIAKGKTTESKSEIFTFLFAGRLDKQKNPLYLVEFSKRLHSACDFRIQVAGEGSLGTKLVQEIEDAGLAPYFEILGYVDEIQPFLQKAHCLIIPSLWEGMPLVVLEAGANLLPILSTYEANSSGMLNHENAYLCPLSDFPAKAQFIISNYEDARKKSASLYDSVSMQYTLDYTYSQLVNVYLNRSAKSIDS